jgi:hypothetical protein
MRPKNDLCKDLNRLIWSHNRFSEALNLVRSYATFSPPGSMVLVVGASGAGKTTLLRQLQRELAGSVDGWPSGTIPIAATPICNDVQGLFNSKNFVLRLLEAVEHPFYGVHQRLPFSAQGIDRGRMLALEKIRLSYSEPHLRIALEKAIEYRKTRYVLLDEAQHLLKASSTLKAVDNLDCIKGLADRTGVVVILFGTFEILPIWNRSAQLNRRLQDIVLHRYYREEEADLLCFEQILESYSQRLPLAQGLSLRDLNEFLYNSTLGIIGEVVRLLIGAYSRMIAANAVTITKDMLQAAAHSPAKLLTLERETLGGEAMLAGPASLSNYPAPTRQEQGKGGRRGKRNPIRDPVSRRESVRLRESGEP